MQQPVQFDHRHHVGDDLIDCRYCHKTVERAPERRASRPTELCLNCHSQVWNKSPLLDLVRASWFAGQPIPWIRVHQLPDFVYFNHSIHVNKGVGCVECHGRVDQMAAIEQVAAAHHGLVPRLPPEPVPAPPPAGGGHQHGVEARGRPRRSSGRSWRRSTTSSRGRAATHAIARRSPSTDRQSGLDARALAHARGARGGGAARDRAGEFPEGAAEAPEGLSPPRLPAGPRRLRRARRPRGPASRRAEKRGPVRPAAAAGVDAERADAYATASPATATPSGVVVTSWEGRPTKVEGNREHPASRGGIGRHPPGRAPRPLRPRPARGFTAQGSEPRDRRRSSRSSPRSRGTTRRTGARGSASSSSRPPRRRSASCAGASWRGSRSARFDAWSAPRDDARAGRPPRLRAAARRRRSAGDADVILSLDADFLGHDGSPRRRGSRAARPPRAPVASAAKRGWGGG